ncbi:MAG: NADH:ubiquinone reductase (Na(+)-transporting) subunit F [Rikenellaceae bacterium]|nr:NADH:ubiquinone reductase (Na(+)-transporting) subunit F [Rikenellaceae bacterium]MCL2692045.1 NADH:ubiquinone reductase (Na(+)-transporting) subunit F [Rikenellaceae bacterium]
MQTLTIIIAIVAFTVIVLGLVALLLYAKSKLTTSGTVTIDINGGERMVEAEGGSTLVSTLADSGGIYLPAACGGKGACGLCKCQVFSGGGEILETEKPFFSRKEQMDSWRLGCQVKVKENMTVGVPEEILGVRKWECEVISNHNVATYIKEFVVRLPVGEEMAFRSGGYVQIDVPKYAGLRFDSFEIEEEYRDEWDATKMWGLVARNPEPTFRAYSMANHPAEGSIVMLNIRIATPPWERTSGTFKRVNPGICSSYIFGLTSGDKVTISGPYGEFFLRETPSEKMFIGGGAGMAPMRSHIFHLFHTERTSLPVTFWYGARSLREVFYQDEFETIEREFPNFRFGLALSEPKKEDRWKGMTGFIHNVIYENYLKDHPAPEDIEYYLCGPPMMIAAVLGMLDNLGVPSENIMFDDFGN